MHSPRISTILLAMACLGAGACPANGTDVSVAPEAAVPVAQPFLPPPALASAMPMVPVWIPVPAGPLRPYYFVPQPVPTLGVPAGWAPFFMVLVPAVPAQAPVSAEVDYGPVADTPVVELPSPVSPGAGLLPKAIESGPAVPAAPPSPPEASARAAAGASAVDYGPVSDTPIVDLPVPAAPVPPAQPAPFTAGESRAAPTRQKASKKSAAPRRVAPHAKTKPLPKKRMCWSGGVVAPCK